MGNDKKFEKVETKKVDEKASKPKDLAKDSTTYIMKVVFLGWGANKKNHFYATKKPVISCVKMGKYHGEIDVWLKAGWIEKGSYKK